MCLNDGKDGIIYNRFFDTVRRAGGLIIFVAAADKIGIFLFSATGHSAYHRASAVCTVNLPGKRMDAGCTGRASCIIQHELLNKIELSIGNNRLMSVFCPRPFALRFNHSLFNLVVRRSGFALYQCSGINLVLENTIYRNGTPQSNLLRLETGALL